MKKDKKQSGIKKEDYPKTYILLKDLEELVNDREEYPKW
jgi:hypothetical protein